MKRNNLSPVASRLVSLSLVVGILVNDLDRRDNGSPVDSRARKRGTPRRKLRGIPAHSGKYERWFLLALLAEVLLLSLSIALELNKLLR